MWLKLDIELNTEEITKHPMKNIASDLIVFHRRYLYIFSVGRNIFRIKLDLTVNLLMCKRLSS